MNRVDILVSPIMHILAEGICREGQDRTRWCVPAWINSSLSLRER